MEPCHRPCSIRRMLTPAAAVPPSGAGGLPWPLRTSRPFHTAEGGCATLPRRGSAGCRGRSRSPRQTHSAGPDACPAKPRQGRPFVAPRDRREPGESGAHEEGNPGRGDRDARTQNPSGRIWRERPARSPLPRLARHCRILAHACARGVHTPPPCGGLVRLGARLNLARHCARGDRAPPQAAGLFDQAHT